MVTGPVTWNMKVALERAHAATPAPNWVVAIGDCALDCGVFAGSPAIAGPVSAIIPVDLHIAGCPPAPIDMLRGLIALVDGQAK
jgi:Ni,Fe-hydrogenase III small subunit